MAHAPNPAHSPTAAPAEPSPAGRGFAPLRWLRKSPLLAGAALLGLVAVIGGGIAIGLTYSSGNEQEASLASALAELDAGNFDQARELAAKLRGDSHQSFTTLGGAYYVLGAVMARDAQKPTNLEEQRLLHLIAARYLEESRLRGFPEGRENEGLLMLGRSLHHGGRYTAAAVILKEVVTEQPSSRAEAYYLLGDSYLRMTPANLPQAAIFTRRLLAEKTLSALRRHEGLLLQGQVALAERQFDAGRLALTQIPTSSPVNTAAVLLSVRLLVEQLAAQPSSETARSPEETQAIHEAQTALAALQRQTRLEAGERGRAQLLEALCLEKLGELDSAALQYARIHKAHFGTGESLAASIFGAELALRQSRLDQALSLFKEALVEAGPRETFQNDWLSLDGLEGRLKSAYNSFLSAEDFSRADELARAFPPLVAASLSLELRAQAQHAWALHEMALAGKQTGNEQAASLHLAREHFRQAGADYESLAKERIATEFYLDDLNASARDYLAGQGYRRAVRVYRTLLRQDSQSGRPEALVGLGEALLATGDTDAALAALAICRENHPKHPSTYRARYLTSLAYQELGKLAEAKEQLEDNLYKFSLTPDSSEWRDSLFLLGKLLYEEGQEHEARSRQAGVDQSNPEFKKPGLKELEQAHALFQKAIAVLIEATQRYPEAADSVQGRYFLADAHRQAAKWARKRLDVTSIEATRATLVRDMQAELEAALTEYGQLITSLGDKALGLDAGGLEILRNSYFGRADSLFDLGRYEEAALAYSAATNRYQHEPEAVAAYVQIASCYRRLGRQEEARGTLEQARVVLSRIKNDADFTKTTPYNRDEWNRLLTWLVQL